MATVTLSPMPKIQFFDNNGIPLSAGKLYTYIPGTNNLKATYTDQTGSVQNTNPVVADAAGRMNLWLSGYYDMKLTDAAGNTIWTVLNVSSAGSASSGVLAGEVNLVSAALGAQVFTMPVGEAVIVKTDNTVNLVNVTCLGGYTFADGVGVSLAVQNESVTYTLIGTVYYKI